MFCQPGLYLVSTPIGNLADISFRAINILEKSDLIFCEDTRIANKLLAKYNIDTKLKLYNDNSNEAQRNYISALIKQGKIISLITDAGTPLISDPGYKLVRELRRQNIHIESIPGACAAITALIISGLPTNQFFFAGFIPKTNSARQEFFKKLEPVAATMIFYETAKRLLPSLQMALAIFGNRQAFVARELTKLYQETNYAKLANLVEHYQQQIVKGELVLCIEGFSAEIINPLTVKAALKKLLARGETAKSATDILYSDYKGQFKKREIYEMANSLKESRFTGEGH